MNGKASFMEAAFEQAVLARDRGEVPIGAVLVKNGSILAADGNRTLELKDPTAHAEILVIRSAAQILSSERLPECDLYVTLEPCPMCATAISFARIRRLYFGAYDAKSGGVENGVRYFNDATCHHSPEVYSGLMETNSSDLLKEFFAEKRR
jgi:tRNA(Arg) A34 adenosine deaminase TadA